MGINFPLTLHFLSYILDAPALRNEHHYLGSEMNITISGFHTLGVAKVQFFWSFSPNRGSKFLMKMLGFSAILQEKLFVIILDIYT